MKKPLYLYTVVAALGGLLFGYDTAVVSGAVSSLRIRFELSSEMEGWAVSVAIIGCIFGVMAAGELGDRLGRKKSLLISAFLFTVSAIFSAVPQTLTQFVWARFIGGLGIGVASIISPMYIAEIAPEKIRGRLVALYQMAIVIGIFVVFYVNMLIQGRGNEAWNVASGWRWMFGSETLPAVLFGLSVLFVPESPRWLMKMGRKEEAYEVLAKVGGSEHATKEIEQIEGSLVQEEGKISELFHSGFRLALFIGIALAVFSQLSGINAIMYYAPEIFKAIGTTADDAYVKAVYIGGVNIVFTLLAIWLVDKVGRKLMLIVGITVQCMALCGVGYLYHINGSGTLLLAFILIFVASFAASTGPIGWIVISEIFPNKIRGRAMGIATFFLWSACYLVSQTFPMLVDSIGSSLTFFFYALCCLLAVFFVLKFVPETKGRTLEEIEKSWMKK